MHVGGISGSRRLQPLARSCLHDNVAQEPDELLDSHFWDLNVVLRHRIITNSFDESNKGGRQRRYFAQLGVKVRLYSDGRNKMMAMHLL